MIPEQWSGNTGLESQRVRFDNSVKPLSSVNVCRSSPNLQIHISGYFLPPTRMPPIAGLQYLLEHHTLALFESTQSFINQL